MSKPNGKVVASAGTTEAPSSETQELTDNPLVAASPVEQHPDPEVVERPTRRHYSARYKLKVLEQTDELDGGQVGAYLRREGLYWSILCTWRKQRETGALAGLEPQQRGPKAKAAANPDARRVSQLEKENAKLQEQNRRLALVLEIQKKVLLLCGEAVPDEKASSSS